MRLPATAGDRLRLRRRAAGTRQGRPAVRARLRRISRRRSLRARLMVGVLVLVALGLLVADIASLALLRSYLIGRMDEQLRFAQTQLARVEQLRGSPPDMQHLDNERREAWRALQGMLDVYVVEYRDADGDVVARYTGIRRADALPDLPPLALPQARERAGRPFRVETRGDRHRVGYRVLVRVWPGDQGTTTVAVDLSESAATVGRLLIIEAGVTLTVLVLVGLLGRTVVRVGLRPLDDVEDTAEAIIAGGDLSRRVPADADPRTEIGRLSTTLNTMLTQIERAFRQHAQSEQRLRQFAADASHELRTPLASIRGLAELHRQGAVHDPDEVTRLLGRIEAEATRMGLLVEDLLLLARLDQQRPLAREPVDLVPIAADAIHDARAIDPGRRIDLELLHTETPVVLGDEPRLRQVAANLLSNALTHTPPGTPVAVRVGTRHTPDGADDEDGEHYALLEVIDHGPGLPPEHGERVFERFHRADPARSHHHVHQPAAGAGLGLSIVAAIVGAHGGRAEHTPTPGGGATFRILLPL